MAWTVPQRGVVVPKGNSLARNLVGAWILDHGRNISVFDLSGSNNNGTLEGFTFDSDYRGTKWGSGYFFDGTNNRIDCGDIRSPSTGVSVAVWMYLPDIGADTSNNGPAFKSLSGDPFLTWGLKTGGNASGDIIINFACGISGTLRSSGIIQRNDLKNTWLFEAGTWQSGKPIRAYVNGSLVTESSNFSGTLNHEAKSFYIGFNEIDNVYYEGAISHCYLWNRGLEPAEIKELHLNPFAIFEDMNTKPFTFGDLDVAAAVPSNLMRIERRYLRGVGRGIMRGAA